jgi:RNA polymerase sigma factor (sigma-70 family)
MRPGQSGALRQLRALFQVGTATGLTDRELLERYTSRRAESAEAAAAAEMAFAALMDRHGAMVWGVCRRVLGNADDAEDAFQATFLILVRKARSVRVDGSLGRWLYGVAHRVALRARAEAQQRRSAIGGVPPPSSADPAGETELSDLRNVVGEAVDALPMKYRCPVELCHLQGMTYDQAAQQLNWPVATVKNRLTKGRLSLRASLTRRGLAPSVVVASVTTALSDEASAALPQHLVRSTARAATTRATSAFPAAVTELASGVLKMMIWEKLRLAPIGILVAAALTAQVLWHHSANGRVRAERPPQTAARPVEEPNENEVRDRRWARSLPSGATIEVIGISSVPSGPDTWWRPDGSPLQRAPSDPIEHEVDAEGFTQRRIVVRLLRIPPGADPGWSIVEANGGAHGPARRGGKLVPGLSENTASLPAEARTCTVRFKVATGPWNTIATIGKFAGGGGARFDVGYIFGDAIATAKGTSLSVTHNIENQSIRIAAVDDDGKELAAVIRSTTDVTHFRQVTVEFDQPPNRIKEFQLQVRPYEQVEIPGIALERN